jgi:hypothetical protein
MNHVNSRLRCSNPECPNKYIEFDDIVEKDNEYLCMDCRGPEKLRNYWQDILNVVVFIVTLGGRR